MSVIQDTESVESAPATAESGYPSASALQADIEAAVNSVATDAPAADSAGLPAETAPTPAEVPETAPPADTAQPATITFTEAQFQAFLARFQAPQQPTAPAAPATPAAPAAPLTHAQKAARVELGEGLPDHWYSRAEKLLASRAKWEPHANMEGETGQRAQAILRDVDDRLADLRIQADTYGAYQQTQRREQESSKTASMRAVVTDLITPEILAKHNYPALSAALAGGTLQAKQLLDAVEPAIAAGDSAAIDRLLAPWEVAFAARPATPAAAATPAPAAKPAGTTIANPAVVAPTSQGGHAAPPANDKYPSIKDYHAEATRRWAQ